MCRYIRAEGGDGLVADRIGCYGPCARICLRVNISASRSDHRRKGRTLLTELVSSSAPCQLRLLASSEAAGMVGTVRITATGNYLRATRCLTCTKRAGKEICSIYSSRKVILRGWEAYAHNNDFRIPRQSSELSYLYIESKGLCWPNRCGGTRISCSAQIPLPRSGNSVCGSNAVYSTGYRLFSFCCRGRPRGVCRDSAGCGLRSE